VYSRVNAGGWDVASRHAARYSLTHVRIPQRPVRAASNAHVLPQPACARAPRVAAEEAWGEEAIGDRDVDDGKAGDGDARLRRARRVSEREEERAARARPE
jgi:hypothetical protein